MDSKLCDADSPHRRNRPRSGTKTGRVWEIADEISRMTGRRAKHAEVMRRYVDEEDGEGTTCTTTYYQWKSSYDRHIGDSGQSRTDPALSEPVSVTIGPDGRVVIPASIRLAMDLDRDGAAKISIDEDGVVTLVSRGAAVRRLQRIVRANDRGVGSVVDELIAERRAEAAREDAELDG